MAKKRKVKGAKPNALKEAFEILLNKDRDQLILESLNKDSELKEPLIVGACTSDVGKHQFPDLTEDFKSWWGEMGMMIGVDEAEEAWDHQQTKINYLKGSIDLLEEKLSEAKKINTMAIEWARESGHLEELESFIKDKPKQKNRP